MGGGHGCTRLQGSVSVMDRHEIKEFLGEQIGPLKFGDDVCDVVVDIADFFLQILFEELLKLANHAGRKVPFYF